MSDISETVTAIFGIAIILFLCISGCGKEQDRAERQLNKERSDFITAGYVQQEYCKHFEKKWVRP